MDRFNRQLWFWSLLLASGWIAGFVYAPWITLGLFVGAHALNIGLYFLWKRS